MAAGYTVVSGSVALSAATARTVVNVINAANKLIRLTDFQVSFDGVTATAVPVLVELCNSTQATAGTSSAGTIRQLRGPTRTVGATAAVAYTAEPTVLTTLKSWWVRADGGLLIIQFPLGREPEQVTTADGLCIRCTAPATVNVRAGIEFEEG